jgi:5-carboxymethyl-2-hydroxymuconate isomerase
MPHFILDCSKNILEIQEARKIINSVFEAAFSKGLFDKNDIKVRLNPFKHSLVQIGKADFIHVFGNIMEGRTAEQKANLSKIVVGKLNILFPEVPIISMNIRDFEKETYYNKSMI